jgi:hypothetical protein
LGFTGQFDFYLLTRESDPVINRISNPGLFWRMPIRAWWPTLSKSTFMFLGLEHRSDGQVFEATKVTDKVDGPVVAQQAYAAKDRQFFDTISRGSNFFSLHAEFDQRLSPGYRFDYEATLRAYVSQNSEITWGPLKAKGYSISDYDRLSTRVGLSTPAFGYWELAWRLGDRGLKTDSMTLGWQAPKAWFPLYVRVHRGPMNTLSNYSQRQDSIGIGLRFTAF